MGVDVGAQNYFASRQPSLTEDEVYALLRGETRYEALLVAEYGPRIKGVYDEPG